MSKAIQLLSGGLDSSTLLYYLRNMNLEVHALGVDYGQRHKKELYAAAEVAEYAEVQFDVIDLSSVGALLKGSSLTDNTVEVPDGHYTDETMKITVVPNRNAIMLSVAWGVAVAEHAVEVAIAAHSGDHAIYPDCRYEFFEQLDRALATGTEGFKEPSLVLYAPFVNWSKADIVKWGYDNGVPYGLTWSCYRGGADHCGACGTCVERIGAFIDAGVSDPTAYENKEFALKQLKDASAV